MVICIESSRIMDHHGFIIYMQSPSTIHPITCRIKGASAPSDPSEPRRLPNERPPFHTSMFAIGLESLRRCSRTTRESSRVAGTALGLTRDRSHLTTNGWSTCPFLQLRAVFQPFCLHHSCSTLNQPYGDKSRVTAPTAATESVAFCLLHSRLRAPQS